MLLWESPSLIDRVGEIRHDPEAIAGVWAQDSSRLLAVDPHGRLPVRTLAGDLPNDAWGAASQVIAGRRSPARLQAALDTTPTGGAYDPQRHWLIGIADGSALFVTPVDEAAGFWSVREAVPLLSPAEGEMAMGAAAITQYHRLEPFCPRCGHPSVPTSGGTARHCPSCGRDLFPRTDPAVIVAVLDGSDRILLGHQRVWPEGRYSVLAGFVEAGESLEQAVVREVGEEVGVAVSGLRFVGSQPWPMPRSLMVGFTARAADVAITVDGDEIADAAWFSRADLRAAVSSGGLILPGEASIAYRLIAGWLDDPAAGRA